MKKTIAILTLAALSITSCQKRIEGVTGSTPVNGKTISAEKNGFIKYTIKQGEQYCDKTALEPARYQQLDFQVRFDSSAVYHTRLETNQNDINKLFGFSDNNAAHHQFSARFGWRWSNNSLRLFGYTYNRGVRRSEELGTVAIETVNSCSIKVNGDRYVFVLNGIETTMLRESNTVVAEGYKLFPYFGGDELAPHTISIWIKEW